MSRAVLEQWRTRSVTSNPICRRCRYSSYCGGGCAALAEEHSGTIHANYCDSFARRFRHSAVSAYLDHLAGTDRGAAADRVCDL